jgi:predicted ferric reductase
MLSVSSKSPLGRLMQRVNTIRTRRKSVPLPRSWSLRPSDLIGVVIGGGLLVVAMWVRHGGFTSVTSLARLFTGVGQLTALLGTYLVLLQLVLMSRSPFIEQVLGMDRLTAAHKWNGFLAFWLITAHLVFTTLGYAAADGSTVVAEFLTFLATYPWVLAATLGFIILTVVAMTSGRSARRSIGYDAWYLIHLGTYLAIALAFAHQLLVGVDFIDDPLARIVWVGLYLLTFGLIVAFRFGAPFVLSMRHRFRVAKIVRESPGVVSIYVAGDHLERLAVRAGQYFVWRFAAPGGWWRAHPFSISAAPDGYHLRVTVKELGDWSGALQRLRPGTRVYAEGPYGMFTDVVRTKPKVLLVAGGIGITPLRALFEEMPGPPGAITLLYRAPRSRDLVFRAELDVLAAARGARVVYLTGPRTPTTDPLSPDALLGLVPDIAERDVFMCGPTSMMQSLRRSLRSLSVPAAQIHWERFNH